MSDGQALKFGRYKSDSNCLATLILTTISRRLLFSAFFKIGLLKTVPFEDLARSEGSSPLDEGIGDTKVQWCDAPHYYMLVGM